MLCPEKKKAWSYAYVAHALMAKEIDKALSCEGQVSLEVYDVLLNLEMASDGKLKMSTLADAVLLSRSGLTRLIDRMERKGYIERHSCKMDRRATYAVITKAGLEARAEAWKTFEKEIEKFFGINIEKGEEAFLIEFYNRILKQLRHPIN